LAQGVLPQDLSDLSPSLFEVALIEQIC